MVISAIVIRILSPFHSPLIISPRSPDGSLFLVTKVDALLIFLNFISQTESKFNDAYHVVAENDPLYKCLTKNKAVHLEAIVDVKSG